MNPSISVIIPVYNGAAYVGKAIDSVLAQQYPVHEIIVIDDGSTDGTPELLKSYGDRLITRRIPQSGGPATPKNVGLSLATGDYVSFLDHDDIWFKDKLAVQVEMARKYPDVGFFACNYAVRYPHMGNRLVDHFSKLRYRSRMNFDGPLKEHPFRLLMTENFIGTTSSAMIRRDVIGKVGGFSTEHGFTEDYLYWFRCAAHTNFILVSRMMMFKRTHAANVTLNTRKMFEWHQKVLETVGKEYDDLIRSRGWMGVYRSALAANEFQLGNILYDMRKYSEAFSFYRQALRHKPDAHGILNYFWTLLKKSARFLLFDRSTQRPLGRITEAEK